MEKQRFSMRVITEVWPQMLSRLHMTFTRKKMNMLKIESEMLGDESFHRFDFLSEMNESKLKLVARQIYRTVGILNVELYVNNQKLNFKKL